MLAVSEPEIPILPRQVLCVLGAWTSLDEVEAIVSATSFTLDRDESALAPDVRMPKSFETSADRVTPSMTDGDLAAIRDHRAVAYVCSPPIERANALALATVALTLIGRLF